MQFTIIIPFFNEAKNIERCIRSITSNNLSNTEIIFVNDGSTDESVKILKKFLNKNIKLISNTRKYGVSYSRNKALNSACGEYIIFIDADDQIANNMISKLRNEIKNHRCDFFYIRNKLNDLFDENEIKKSYSNNIFHCKFPKIIKNNFYFRATVWNFIIRKELIIENKICFGGAKIYEDQIFLSKIFLKAKNFKVLKKPMYFKSVDNPNSLGREIGFKVAYSSLIMIFEAAETIKKYNFIDKKFNEFLVTRIQFGLQELILNLLICSIFQKNRILNFMNKKKDIFKYINNISFRYKDFILQNKTIFNSNHFKKRINSIINRKNKLIISQCKKHKKDKVYLFCNSQITKVYLRICKLKNIKINGIIDNNILFKNKYVESVKIHGQEFLNLQPQTNSLIIVNHLEKKVALKIKINLSKKFKKSDVVLSKLL